MALEPYPPPGYASEKLRGEIDSSGVRVAIVNSVNPANTEVIRERILAKLAALSGPIRLIAAT